MMNVLGLEEIKTEIRNLRSNGKFAEGASFIQSLSPEIKATTCVSIEIAQLYLVQGQLRSAADVCEKVSTTPIFTKQLHGPDLDPETTAFELIHAYINILRYSRLKTALKIAQCVAEAWKLRDEDQRSDVETEEYVSVINQDGYGPKTDSKSPMRPKNGKTVSNLNEYRILLEFYFWKILVTAAEQGLLEEKSTKAMATMKIGGLRKMMQVAGRFREARYLIYFEVGMITSTENAIKELGEFIELISDSKWDTERALSLVDLGERQLQSTDSKVVVAAEESFRSADELFTKTDHGFGRIDVELSRLSGNKTISTGEMFAFKERIAQLYFDVGHIQNGIRCLTFGISPEMVLDLYGDRVVQALDQLNSKIEESGSEMLRQISLIHSVCQAVLKAPEYGFALQSIESYYSNLPEEIGPKYHTLLAMTLASIYSNFGEYRKALKVAEEGLEVANSGKSYEIISDAVLRIGHHKIELAENDTENFQAANNLIECALDLLKEWADKDAENGYVDGEVDKCLIICNRENSQAVKQAKVSNHTGITIGPVEQPWIDRIKRYIPDSSPPSKRTLIVDVEVRMLMRQMRFSESLELSNKFLGELNNNTESHPFIKAQAMFRSAVQSYANSMNIFGSGQPLSQEVAHSAQQLMWTSLKISINALELYRQANGTEAALNCTSFVWSLLSQVLVVLKEPEAKGLLEAFMSELLKTENLCDQMRRSVIPIGGLKALMNKRALVSKKTSLELYRIGVDVSLRLDDAASTWNWLQKGKARAFGDSLGANLLIPKSLLEKISSDSIAVDLLSQEQSALEALSEPRVDYVIAARHLASIRAKMEQNPLLVEVMRFKDGTIDLSLDANDLKQALEQTGLSPTQVKFVDWFIPQSTGNTESNIVQLIRLLDGTTTKRELSINSKTVHAWIQKAFKYPYMSDPPLSKKTGNRFLQQMNALVEGLSESTNPNDLIVLSPSGILNNMPLHALFVDGQPLIQRNLVVYSSNIAVFQQCLSRVNSALHSVGQQTKQNDECSRKFFAVYEEPDEVDERASIFNHIKILASKFAGEPFFGPKVTKPNLLKQCSAGKWIHYHGHAKYSSDNVLDSSLILSNGRDLFQEEIDDAKLGRDELSIPELFNVQLLQNGVHFTVIACDSGTQDIAPGDEPLGIISALLHAGATSVLGCQWPIDSRAGRAMSEAFYEELNRTRQNSGANTNILSLAKALQEVTRKMRRGELGEGYKQAYFWAPFALYGLWFFLNS
jgi:CHAT domain-containing protein